MKNKIKLFLIIGFLSIIGIGLASVTLKSGGQIDIPVKKIEIHLQANQMTKYFEQMQKFAENYGFAFRVAETAPTGEDFIVELWREDFKILAVNPFDKNIFRVSIFNISGREIPEADLENVVGALRNHALRLDGAEFKEQHLK